MNRYLRVFGLVALLCFSFYYTEQIAHFMRSKDPIYESIMVFREDHELPSFNAEIIDDYIIPGLSGKTVNVEKSFRNMKNLGYFTESLFVFDELKPEISLENNLDKIISQGNPSKQAVSLLIESESHRLYLEEMGVFYALLTTKDNMNKVLTNGIKINHDFGNYDTVLKELKLKKEDTPYCLVTNKDEEFCRKKKKVLIQETLRLDRSNFSKLYNAVSSGAILSISDNLSLSNLQLLLNQIYFKGYKIVSLDELLSESRN